MLRARSREPENLLRIFLIRKKSTPSGRARRELQTCTSEPLETITLFSREKGKFRECQNPLNSPRGWVSSFSGEPTEISRDLLLSALPPALRRCRHVRVIHDAKHNYTLAHFIRLVVVAFSPFWTLSSRVETNQYVVAVDSRVAAA